jgi:orotate phosphoribosyltransferase
VGKDTVRLWPGQQCYFNGPAQPKEHGAPKDKYFVGAPKGRIAVIEDVTTTGGQVLTRLISNRISYDVMA